MHRLPAALAPQFSRMGRQLHDDTATRNGLGTCRGVIERTFAWLHGFRRPRIRWERRADIHEGVARTRLCLIALRQLTPLYRPLLARNRPGDHTSLAY
jgi:hypothetical protein